ncbi:hypothetical protein FSP39_013399 [Pinctada imbricata]|uniref:BAI1-associated protein 3 n=1 Tax=Pinctada imbricata TaxID=66713 RepID=A0AA88Y0W9_PINIB|nr:hypothetical protein FSP39_013399 [Pinctada imbricata]
MLGIMPGRLVGEDLSGLAVFSDEEDQGGEKREKKRSSLRRFSLTSSKKKKDKTVKELLPARLIKTTDVKPNTLNPIWEEKFRLDHDDEFSVLDATRKLNEVQGIKGLGRFFKQVAQSARSRRSDGDVDDFLGCVDVEFNDLPSTGEEKWFKLEGRSSRSNIQGDIKLRLSLATREDRGLPEDDNWTDVRQHEDLICVFIQHEIRNLHEPAITWGGELRKAADTILHQHAIQGDITKIQRAVCRWMAYSRKHMEHTFSYDLLYKLLDDLDQCWMPDSLSREEEQGLSESFTTFNTYCLSIIRKQRDVFPYTNKHAVSRLSKMMSCLMKIYSMKVFKYVCPFAKELYSEVNSCIKAVDHDDQVIQSLIELTNSLNADLYGAFHNYKKIYDVLDHVSYFSTTYRQLEKLLGEEFHSCMKETKKGRNHEEQPMGILWGPQILKLYLALQEFCSYKDELTEEEQRHLHIVKYYTWFRYAVQKWVNIVSHKVMQRISKAVELDNVAETSSGAKYSTSAVDVCCCFSQVTEFWRQLNWPDLVDSFPMVLKITEDLSKGARMYADLIHKRLIQKGYYDEVGQFDITEQLCITINNIEQVRRALKQLPDTLRYVDVQHAVESSNGSTHGHKFNLHSTLKAADEMMVSKIKQVVDRVADKMRPDIKKDIFHLNWAPESLPAEEAVDDLMKYLDSNLQTLNEHLLKTNFDRILESIWIEVLEEFNEVLTTEEVRKPVFYQRMYDALGLLVNFFNANEKGLPIQRIQCDQYKDLKLSLSLHKKDTFSLISRFFEEKLHQQQTFKGTEYGVLNVRMCYRHDSQTMIVEVLNAKDIIPLDANGFSDPYVVIQFCPEHIFPHVPIQETAIQKKTLNPTFDESFEFSVTAEQCKRRSAVLVFTVMDHDYVFQNDFAGEAYVSLADIPGVDGEDVTGFEALSVVTLPLMQPKHKEKGALDILASRTWDKDAQEFVKKRTKLEEQAQ